MLELFKTEPAWFFENVFFEFCCFTLFSFEYYAVNYTGQQIRSKIDSFQNANFLISQPNPMMLKFNFGNILFETVLCWRQKGWSQDQAGVGPTYVGLDLGLSLFAIVLILID